MSLSPIQGVDRPWLIYIYISTNQLTHCFVFELSFGQVEKARKTYQVRLCRRWWLDSRAFRLVESSPKGNLLLDRYSPENDHMTSWKITILNVLNRRYIFKRLVFHCHVGFPGCRFFCLRNHDTCLRKIIPT